MTNTEITALWLAFYAVAIPFNLYAAIMGAIELLNVRKVGGIWFWNVGRLGGSFYVKRAAPVRKAKPQRAMLRLDYDPYFIGD